MKNKRLDIRITEAMLSHCLEKAKEFGGKSDYIRYLIRRDMEKEGGKKCE